MTTEGATPGIDVADEGEPAALRCYRHPDRETWVRCGRCDQPICSRCAMQGPVGFRCRECGRPARDPLTSMRPTQALVGFGVALVGGLLVGLVSGRVGLFGLLLAWFGGGLVADAVIRFVGFKRGPRMAAILFGGILLGTALVFVGEAAAFAASVGADASGASAMMWTYVYDRGAWAAVAAGLACFGAWSRFRL